MKVVVAMDSFKGSASAKQACESVQRGILARLPDAQIVMRPMADGGEGTAETLLEVSGDGEWVGVDTMGPLPSMSVEAGFVWLPRSGPGALIEMAKASGLELLATDQMDPMVTTTVGTGELLAEALQRGAKRIWLAIGGSATVDGGIGVAEALGWALLDEKERAVSPNGAGLRNIRQIKRPECGAYSEVEVEVLCDVDNPLLGVRGAAHVLGPQKGATAEMVEQLEAGLINFANVIESDLGKDVRDIPGAGAAGGLGAGAIAFLNAKLVSGIDAVMDASGLNEALVDADWVVTGEGCFDQQSLNGKVVSGVVKRAHQAGCRVAVVAGSIALDAETAQAGGVEEVEAVSSTKIPSGEALARGTEFIEVAAVRLAEKLKKPR